MKKQASKKNRMTLILLLAVLLAGLSLLLYPMVADYWNSMHQSQAIASYQETVAEMDDETYETLWQAAEDYNSGLLGNADRFQPTQEEHQRYEELLDVSGSGVMGYVEIPSIDVSLPIYHGTDSSVLNIAVGHLEGSSLPVGGESTHCVLSAHRGLPSARLFTDLDRLKTGDTFTLSVLNRLLTYEIDQILIVKPEEVDTLAIEPGQDLCTLVTCTPYGINSHRLLVQGHRVENTAPKPEIFVPADMVQIDPLVVTPIVAVPMLLVLLIFLLIRYRKRS